MKIVTIFLLILLTSLNAGIYSGGSGTQSDPYQIATKADLIELSKTPSDWDKYFKQTQDITFNADPTLEDWDGDGTPDGAGTTGFSPIGNLTTRFSGYFLGKTINNLYINNPAATIVGLFGVIDSFDQPNFKGLVQGINVLNANVTADCNAGILAGINYGQIEVCTISGTFTASCAAGSVVGHNHGKIVMTTSSCSVNLTGSPGGGLVGWNHETGTLTLSEYYGSVISSTNEAGGIAGNNDGTISMCRSQGSVTGLNYIGGIAANNSGSIESTENYSTPSGIDYVGGLCGGNSGLISNSINYANVSGDDLLGGLTGINYGTVGGAMSICTVDGDGYVGGGIGENSGTIRESMTFGIVNATGNNIGGLCGKNLSMVSNCLSFAKVDGGDDVGGLVGENEASTINNSYSTGNVSGTGDIGGLVGNNSGTVTASFWDTERSGISTSAAGTGKTTAEMKNHTTFTAVGWDFVVETANGTDDIWDMDYSGTLLYGYPYLGWLDGDDYSLPVNLSAFTAIAGNGSVIIQWVTESEVNNEAFLLERSTDGQTFQLLAQIPGQGNKPGRTEYQFTDHNVINGQTYYYRLADRDANGKVTYHNIIRATPTENGVKQLDAGLIENYTLFPAYPNPFNPETTIRFDIPNREHKAVMVNIDIFDLLGRKVATLYNGMATGGSFEVKWDGRDDAGNRLPSGMYLINFKSDSYYQVQKIILAK